MSFPLFLVSQEHLFRAILMMFLFVCVSRSHLLHDRLEVISIWLKVATALWFKAPSCIPLSDHLKTWCKTKSRRSQDSTAPSRLVTTCDLPESVLCEMADFNLWHFISCSQGQNPFKTDEFIDLEPHFDSSFKLDRLPRPGTAILHTFSLILVVIISLWGWRKLWWDTSWGDIPISHAMLGIVHSRLEWWTWHTLVILTVFFFFLKTCHPASPSTSLMPRREIKRKSDAEPLTVSPDGLKASRFCLSFVNAPAWSRGSLSVEGKYSVFFLCRCLQTTKWDSWRRGLCCCSDLHQSDHQ